MQHIFEVVNNLFAFFVPISDLLWDFPKNVAAWAAIPVLGQFSLAMLMLLGTGLWFTFRTGAVQLRRFGESVRIVMDRKASETGISPFAAFMLSSAMRAGPGNIMGVTGAVTVGGPGALFWMWVAGIFGMATGFAEATLAQLFKEKKESEFLGGLPFYGMRILGNRRWVGVTLAALFITYALLNVPSQTFHLFTALGSVASTLAGTTYGRTSAAYYAIGAFLIVSVAVARPRGPEARHPLHGPLRAVHGGPLLRRRLRPRRRQLAARPVLLRVGLRGRVLPEAIFGGVFGVALQQGIKRGLMVNEAGQGTITMAAAAADNRHPVEQGLVQSMGVFFDTIVICSMAGFVTVMARLWTVPTFAWEATKHDKLVVFMSSAVHLAPGDRASTRRSRSRSPSATPSSPSRRSSG